jgi:hypothetical protein
MSVFSDEFRKRLSDALGATLVFSCENSALAVAAIVNSFGRGRGIRTLGAIVDNRRSLCRDSKRFRTIVASVARDDSLDSQLYDNVFLGFLRYYATRLPIVISKRVRGKGRPRFHEAAEIMKTALIHFERIHPETLKNAVATGLFVDVFAVLRQTQRFCRPLRESDDFAYSSAWLMRMITGLPMADDESSCEGLIASCIDANIREDHREMAAAALCDIFPLFFNELVGHYVELLLLARIVSEKPFARG